MERTVPRTGGEEIHLFMRTYYSLLRSSGTFQIETLVETHIAMESSLHIGAADLRPDVSALIYSALRLPEAIRYVSQVVLAQTEKSFVEAGYQDVAAWERVTAPGRRRRKHYDGDRTLAIYIVSRSDIDDLIPTLTAYQLEWNKLNLLLQNGAAREFLQQRAGDAPLTEEETHSLADLLKMSAHDLRRLELIWRPRFLETLRQIARERKDIGIRMISGSLSDYRRATAAWWEQLSQVAEQAGLDPEQCPIYFVSSNTHSIVNLLTGFAQRYEENLVDYVKAYNPDELLDEYEDIQRTSYKSMENFLYYVLGKYLGDGKSQALQQLRHDERSAGILRVSNPHGFDIEAQVIQPGRLRPEWLDSRLTADLDTSLLAESDALILNIDYPLGVAAYEILSRITERCHRIQGVYIMGKAATLNARIGDVMLPNVVHDEHSQNTYLFGNCFTAADVRPYMARGSVLDNQKAVTCLGTFLQNPGYMSIFYREGYSDIEMEAGPYLSAVYEAFRPRRHPENEIVNLYAVPFDVGFLHYASDTPMKTGHNLGAGSLNYLGVEPTYATAIAILRRIFKQELARLRVVRNVALQPQV
ncbi:MAG: hypothetical protein MUE40_17750 [Anaerolineae bacterium]|jgi:hypothetical protein|nr:hypothetical protein [Anaerolineae bacterium]